MASPGAHITATGDFNLQTDEGARRFQSLTEALRRLTASTTPKIVPARTLSNSPPFATEGDRAWPVHNQLSSASPPFIPAAQQAAMAAAQPPMVPVLAPYAAPSAPEGDWGASAFLQPHHQHMVVTSAYHPHQAPYQPGPAGHPDPISPVSLVNASGNKPPVPLHPLQPVAVTNDSMMAGDSPTSQRIILVDDRLTDVWQSVVNPADPAKAASNLTRLLPAPNAYEVAAEFLTRPSHTAVIERIPDAGQRLKLAHQVLLALVRRGSTDFAAQWPSTVRLATKSEASAAADVQNAAEALGELLRKDLAPRAVAVTAMTFLLGHPRTVDFALRVLWHCAVASDREHGSPSESSSTAEGAVTQFPELREAVQNALAQTSYVAHRLATAFGWRAPSTTNLTYTAALRALPSDRVAFSPSADTLVTSSYQHGINLWDTAAIAAGEPKVLLADRRIIAVDVIAKKDSVVAVAGPPDVPTLFNVDLKPKGGGAARITASVLMDVDSVTALKTISHRSAAVCLGVVAGKDYELRLYSATGSADRSIAKAHDDFITCIATSSDSDSTIFSGARDGVVRVWDLRSTQRSASSLHPHKAAVSGISASRDVLLTGGLDGTLRLWDVRKLVDPIDTATFDAPVLSLTCTSKGVAFVSTARQLSVMTLHPLALEDTLPGSYHALATTPSGEGLFAVGSGQQGVHVFTLKTA